MRSSLLIIAAEQTEHAAEGLQPIGFGLVAGGILLFLLLVTLAFRSLGTRNRPR
ncbi:hypothetical protein IM660_12180 [Ruania alkalisoli]|uniref:Uncharacterized protein n=1 Tax=Ruania alkalisoli TaxID=2779775 RepID=A0A7M1SQK8_9MICO|nr:MULTISPECIES: hypothetical protein [Ruania]QOR69447.1 hypothetical protein IM660_12180 [Ruania alkalisoli]